VDHEGYDRKQDEQMEKKAGDVKHKKAGNPYHQKKDSHEEKESQTHPPPRPNLIADVRRQSSPKKPGREGLAVWRER
jgi:hypothetical protein